MLAAIDVPDIRLRQPVCLRSSENPRRLMSLWDILRRFKVAEFAVLIGKLKDFETSLMMLSASGKGGTTNERFTETLKGLAEESKLFCNGVGFSDSETAAQLLELKLKEPDAIFNVSHLEVEARHLEQSLIVEAHSRTFVFTRKESSSFIDNPAFFGEDVKRVFLPASSDICEVGNCLAVESPTAAVFHLMRVAEYGLRALAKKLHVRLTHGGLRQPVEFADWEKVITGIKNEITKARALNPGHKRQAKLEMYSDAADHCAYMKDIFRNNISHTRKPYTLPEALSVTGRVRDFMVFLATRLER